MQSTRNSLKPKINQLATTKASEDRMYRDAIMQNKEQVNTELKGILGDINTLKLKIANAEKRYEPQLSDEFDGFQGRMMAFNSLKENESTWWAALFISLLFVVIETAPTFFKMMIASGPYDDLLRAEMHRVRVMSDKEISDLNDEVNTLVQISVAKNKAKLEAELAANKEIMEKVALAQAELLQTAIDLWRKEELKKIEADPSAYIKTSN